jgi:hypothetical protein
VKGDMIELLHKWLLNINELVITFFSVHRNDSTDSWEMPVEDSIRKLEKFIEDY